MKLETLRVQNYKSISNSGTQDLCDLNILIGKNDAGKSSFLEAARIFLSKFGKVYDEHFHLGTDNDIILTGTFSDIPTELAESLNDEIDIPDDTLQIKRVYKRRDQKNPKRITYLGESREWKLSKGTVVNENERLNKSPSRDYIWNYLPEPLYVPAERDVSEETTLKSNTLFDRLLSPLISESEEIKQQISALRSSLNEDIGQLSDDITQKMSNHMPAISNVAVEPGDIELGKAISPEVEITDHSTGRSIPLDERGSGVGSLFILSLIESYKDRHIGEGYFLIFEEPGVWLHPGAQRKMLSAMKAISQEGGQIALSTHSPIFIDRRGHANMFVVQRNEGISSIKGLSSDYFTALDEIGARSSDVLQSDFVIYTEGITDCQIIESVAKNYIENWDELNVVVQHLGGTGNIEHCEPKQLAKINKNLGFILDSDCKPHEGDPNRTESTPNDTALALKRKCVESEFDIPMRILERREIENYFTSTGIEQALHLEVDDGFVTKYEDIPDKIDGELWEDRGGSYSKSKGKDIVENMYDNGERIGEIERFLDKVEARITD